MQRSLESRTSFPEINLSGIGQLIQLLKSIKRGLEPLSSPSPQEPPQFPISGPVTPFLSKIIGEIPPEGTGVVIVPTTKGDVKVDYSCRVICTPPEAYQIDSLRKNP